MTTETTMPPADPVGADEEGRLQIDLSDSLPEGQCWVPQDRMNEFPLMNHVPCADLVVETEAVVEQPVAQPMEWEGPLPATGAMFNLGLVFLAMAFIAGGVCLWLWAHDDDES